MRYEFLRPAEIYPAGWLKRQLDIQADGLSGHLDEIWPDVRDSAWIGGNRDGWERVPYWLDGFIPLAFLTGRVDLQRRAKRYIDAILERQQPDGWLCPCEADERKSYDLWSLFLICKVLHLYHTCTDDARVPDAVYRALQNLHTLLEAGEIRLFDWAKFRWFEALIPLAWVYSLRPEPWLLALAETLETQGADYTAFLEDWITPVNAWRFETHIVNIAMAFKAEAEAAALSGRRCRDTAEKLHRVLTRYNGCACGFFTGDECLSGTSPIQGTELCSVVELAYSYERLLAQTGDVKWADRLERALLNGLPATCTADMWAHQYDQMANQIAAKPFPGRAVFRTNGSDAHCFGLEPNFGCCTANFNQGWPKYALSAFMKNADTLACMLPVPMAVETALGGGTVRAVCETEYPFRHTMRYTVETSGASPVRFALCIPEWAVTARVNGLETDVRGLYTVQLPETGTTVLEVALESPVQLEKRPNRLYAVSWGPLVFALPVEGAWTRREYERDGVARKFPYCDYDVAPTGAWQFALCGGAFKVETHPLTDTPFSREHPPVTLVTEACAIDWGFEDGFLDVCRKTPKSRKPRSAPQTVRLFPYGCTTLRMTELPVLKK